VLVLRSGEQIRYTRYRRTSDRVEVHTPDGTVRIIGADDIDWELEATDAELAARQRDIPD
jgi:hypothetical protein